MEFVPVFEPMNPQKCTAFRNGGVALLVSLVTCFFRLCWEGLLGVRYKCVHVLGGATALRLCVGMAGGYDMVCVV